MSISLGEFPFLNCIPIYYALKMKIIKGPEVRFTVGPPSRLNQLLKEEKIDISPISSIAYLELANDCYILPNLSISSYGQVKSVTFFSHLPYHRLDSVPVLFTSQSATSVALLKLILKRYFGVNPIYIKGELKDTKNGNIVGGLAIGDDALLLKEKGIYPYQLDLGEIWYQLTKLPFVFGIFAIREKILNQSFDISKQIWQSLISSKNWGLNHLRQLASMCVNKLNWRPKDYIDYWSHLDYDLEEIHLRSLHLFFKYLQDEGKIQDMPKIRMANF